RQVVHDPDLVGGPCRHRHRLHADGHRGAVRQARGGHVEDLEAIVWRVDDEEPAPIGRQGQRPDLAALEGDEVAVSRNEVSPGGGAREERERHGDGSEDTAGGYRSHGYLLVGRGLGDRTLAVGRASGSTERSQLARKAAERSQGVQSKSQQNAPMPLFALTPPRAVPYTTSRISRQGEGRDAPSYVLCRGRGGR